MVADDSKDGGTAQAREERGPRLPPWTLGVEAAAVVAVVSGVLYLSGHQYLGSYYGALGLGRAGIAFDVPFVMMTSILPLIHPVFFSTLLAVFCLALREHAPPPTRPNPFHPIPLIQAIAIILSFWTAKLLADLLQPASNVTWLFWGRRDFLFFAFGTATLAYVYWIHWARGLNRAAGPLKSGTASLAGIFLVACALVLFRLVSVGAWPLTALQTVLFLPATGFVVAQVVRDFRSWRRGKLERPPPSRMPTLLTGRDASSTVFLGLLAVMALILSAGLPGTIEARQDLAGCNAYTRIEFDPAPPGITENATLWLLLHHDDLFYVRQVGSDPGSVTMVVPETPGVTVMLAWAPPVNKC